MTESGKVLVPALFMHIQKTAGSSIVDLARLAYGSDQVVSHGDYFLPPKSLNELVDAKGREPSFFSDRSFISGHFGFDFAKPLMRDRYTFTFLRDPIERVLSYYYFCRTRDPNEYEIYALTQKLTLDEFLILGLEVPAVKACIWNNQAWQLANGYGHSNGRKIEAFTPEEILDLAIGHLDEFSYVGFAETFESDRDRILRSLGIVPPKAKVISNANPGRPTAQDLPPSTLRLLESLTELDHVLYKAARARQEARLLQENPSHKKSFFGKYIYKWLNR
jgi:hypothetical protein